MRREKWLATIILMGVLNLLVQLNSLAAEKITLRYWSFLDPKDPGVRSVAQTKQIDNFMARNPNIEVVVEIVHWAKMVPMLITATPAGKGPDIALIFSPRVPMAAEAGAIVPLDEYVVSWTTEEKSDFLIPWDQQFYKGHLWSLHAELRIQGILQYRRDLLNKAGLNVSNSLEELAIAAQKMTTERVWGFVWPLSRKEAAAGLQLLLPMYWGAGGDFLDKDGRAIFNSEVGVRIYQWFYDLVHKYKAMPSGLMAPEELLSAVKAGTVAMCVEGTHRVAPARAGKGIGENLQTAPLPSFDPLKPSPAFGAGQSLCIGANSKNRDAAWKFIEHMISPEMQLINAKIATQMPTRKSVFRDPWFQSPEASDLRQWKEYLEKHGRGYFPPEQWVFLCECLATAAEEVIIVHKPIKKALDDAAARYNAKVGF